MLQPRKYPEMLGKALVLEAEPFIDMVEDDEPWAEGLFLVVLVGVLVGAAQIVGALLTAASMPQPEALFNAVLPLWREFAATRSPASVAGAEEWLRTWWTSSVGVFGFGWSWPQAGWIVLGPFMLAIQWLLYGFVGHGVARALGGNGRLTQTLGATALMAAPQALVLLEVIPFVSVSFALVFVWALLIVYRALEVVHDLPWKKAAWAAVATPALLLLLAIMGVTALSVMAAILGGLA